MHIEPRHGPDPQRLRQWRSRGFVEARRITQRPLDQMVHQRDGDIGHQQTRDGLVHATVVPQRADRADPERPGQHRRKNHPKQCDRRRRPEEHDADGSRGDAAEHDRALAADHHEAEPRRQRHAERCEQER